VSISAIILAGGRAIRMGGLDKGLILFQNKPLITHVITRLKPQVDEIIINANRETDTYQALGYQVLQDEIDNFAGPLAGMQLGLKYASNPYVLTVPCDSPRLPLDLAMRLQTALIAENADISIVTSEDKTHPVFCLCKKSVLTALEDYLKRGGRKVSAWQQSLNHVYVDFSDCAEAFTNLNTQDDLSAFEAKLQSLSPQKLPHDHH
jgi:molybdopterin-guanine dinucleotide biosynthesis protein A